MSDKKPIPSEEWRTIVSNVPLVSVDLLIEFEDEILLGKRENDPAKGEWFVPGGVVRKNETRVEAVNRVAEEELGQNVVIGERTGTFEHFYDVSEFDDIDSKHYLERVIGVNFRATNLP